MKMPFVSRAKYDAMVKLRDEAIKQYTDLVELVLTGKKPSTGELEDELTSSDPSTPSGLRRMAQTDAYRKAGRLA